MANQKEDKKLGFKTDYRLMQVIIIAECSMGIELPIVTKIVLVSFLSGALRTYATKCFPHWNFFNTLYTTCFMFGLSIFVIKKLCHLAHFFIIICASFQPVTNFSNK